MAQTFQSPSSELVTHRQIRPTNVGAINVGETERLVSGLAGGALLGYAIYRRDLRGLVAGVAGAALLYRGYSGHCSLYAALSMDTAHHNPAASIPARQGVKTEHSVTVLRPKAELYEFWRNFENLPRIMRHLVSVRSTGPTTSHWVARGPMGMQVEWDAEVITEREHELIGWRSLEGSEVDTAGSVRFSDAPGGRGTEVRVVLKYNPPAGKSGAWLARALGAAPEQQIPQDLRRLKQLMETGTVPTTQGQPHGSCSGWW